MGRKSNYSESGGARRKAGIIQMEPGEVKKWGEMEWMRTRISEMRWRVEAEKGASSSPMNPPRGQIRVGWRSSVGLREMT